MITLSLIKNAGGAAKYYAADNYYLAEADAKEASEWLGKGAIVSEELINYIINHLKPFFGTSRP